MILKNGLFNVLGPCSIKKCLKEGTVQYAESVQSWGVFLGLAQLPIFPLGIEYVEHFPCLKHILIEHGQMGIEHVENFPYFKHSLGLGLCFKGFGG